ncbi:MAG: carbamoyltransferase [Kofleriaceae bacterium]|nr:carbamoyltransferase [Kofleriaceae bacterium]
MKILGISAFFHDAAAAIVVDGVIVAAAQEERFSRIKQDASLPVQAVRYCLDEAELSMAEIDYVVFYEKPLRKFERILVSQLRAFPRGLRQFGRAMRTWLGSRLWLKSDICKELGCSSQQLLFSEHHLSHAASAYLCSPFQDAAIVTIDGVGESATTSVFHGFAEEGCPKIDLKLELPYPHSIGLLYSSLTAYLGFRVNEGEYKVMGLSSYGQPKYLEEFASLASVGDDGSLEINPRYFSYHYHATKSFTPALEALLGPSRIPGSPLEYPSGDIDMQRYADVAASLQTFTEEYLLVLMGEAKRQTQSNSLCLAGGVALNSVANRRICEEGPFEHVFVQPAAGDAGGALGAALYASCVLHNDPRPRLSSVALGQSFAPASIEKFLDDCGVKYTKYSDDEELADEVAQRMSVGQVGGWFQGRFEWGPRALGNRSILADPRYASTRDRVNRAIKFREKFRPFAPMVLSEDTHLWFDLGRNRDRLLAPFMCSVMPATAAAKEKLSAVVHVDGTARVQVVGRSSNPRTRRLLQAFKKKTGVGVLLNTSMNLKDEPICASPAEAYGAFVRSDMDFLTLENCLIVKDQI